MTKEASKRARDEVRAEIQAAEAEAFAGGPENSTMTRRLMRGLWHEGLVDTVQVGEWRRLPKWPQGDREALARIAVFAMGDEWKRVPNMGQQAIDLLRAHMTKLGYAMPSAPGTKADKRAALEACEDVEDLKAWMREYLL